MSVPRPVEALLRIWPDDFAVVPGGKVASGTCIETSKVVSRCLARFDVPCRVRAVDLWMGNAIAAPLREVPLSEWPPDAWSVGVVSGNGKLAGTAASVAEPHRRTGFNGHIVVVGEDWLIDMTAPQFDRPKHGIHCPGAVVLDGVPGVMDKTPVEVVVGLPGGGEGVYRTRPEVASWRQTNAWREDRDVSRFVDVIVAGVQAVMDDENALAASAEPKELKP